MIEVTLVQPPPAEGEKKSAKKDQTILINPNYIISVTPAEDEKSCTVVMEHSTLQVNEKLEYFKKAKP